jgi:hypothetical protein
MRVPKTLKVMLAVVYLLVGPPVPDRSKGRCHIKMARYPGPPGWGLCGSLLFYLKVRYSRAVIFACQSNLHLESEQAVNLTNPRS